MPDQAINEMISAFASGCMDKENFLHFYHYLKGKGDLPYKELGQLQTLSSILPVILELEYPRADLKNKVARTLISMQDEIKEKIKIEKQKTIEYTKIQKPAEPVKVKVELLENTIQHAEPKAQEAEKNMTNPTPQEPQQNNYINQDNRLFTESVPRPPEPPSFTPVWIVIALLFLGMCGLGYFMYSGFADLKESISKTEAGISSVKNETRNTGEFINRNSALIDFFNYENIWTVQLNGTDPSLKISGKLFIALNEKEALLQLSNMPNPTPEETYQLWMMSKNQTFSMGVFFVEPGSRFVKLSNIPVMPKDQITQFRITIEPRGGSAMPTGKIYVVGLENEAVQKFLKKK
jgi:hypothetical protein